MTRGWRKNLRVGNRTRRARRNGVSAMPPESRIDRDGDPRATRDAARSPKNTAPAHQAVLRPEKEYALGNYRSAVENGVDRQKKPEAIRRRSDGQPRDVVADH